MLKYQFNKISFIELIISCVFMLQNKIYINGSCLMFLLKYQLLKLKFYSFFYDFFLFSTYHVFSSFLPFLLSLFFFCHYQIPISCSFLYILCNLFVPYFPSLPICHSIGIFFFVAIVLLIYYFYFCLNFLVLSIPHNHICAPVHCLIIGILSFEFNGIQTFSIIILLIYQFYLLRNYFFSLIFLMLSYHSYYRCGVLLYLIYYNQNLPCRIFFRLLFGISKVAVIF